MGDKAAGAGPARAEALGDDRGERLFRAALAEFAGKGYELASTNAITRNAGISKGLLFHYFESKKGLFLHVLERSIDFLVGRFTAAGLPPPELDPFAAIMERGIIKLKLAIEQPDMYRLIFSAFTSPNPDLAAELGTIYRRLSALARDFLGRGFDPARLREGVDPAKAMDLLHLFLDGWTNRLMEQYRREGRSYEEVLAGVEDIRGEAEAYFDLIRRGVYK